MSDRIHFSVDGPNMNWAVLNLLKEIKKKMSFQAALNLCGTLKAGEDALGRNFIQNFNVNVEKILDDLPAQREIMQFKFVPNDVLQYTMGEK